MKKKTNIDFGAGFFTGVIVKSLIDFVSGQDIKIPIIEIKKHTHNFEMVQRRFFDKLLNKTKYICKGCGEVKKA